MIYAPTGNSKVSRLSPKVIVSSRGSNVSTLRVNVIIVTEPIAVFHYVGVDCSMEGSRACGCCLQPDTMNLANSIKTTSRLSVVFHRYGITTISRLDRSP